MAHQLRRGAGEAIWTDAQDQDARVRLSPLDISWLRDVEVRVAWLHILIFAVYDSQNYGTTRNTCRTCSESSLIETMTEKHTSPTEMACHSFAAECVPPGADSDIDSYERAGTQAFLRCVCHRLITWGES